MNRGRTAISLIEEGVQLLRASSPAAPAFYCAGTIPFLLALFYFCTEMSYNRAAAGHSSEAALGLGIAYCWMKGLHAMACRVLVDSYTGNRTKWWSFSELVSIWTVQIAYQPFGLFIRPIAWSLVVPGTQISSFFLNLSIIGSFRRGAVHRSWSYARLWFMENQTVHAILCLLWTIVFADLLVTMFAAPFIAKTLLGVDSFLTRTTAWMYSPAILIGLAALAYYVIDFLQKSIHVIRCCDAELLNTGEDLLKKIQTFSRPRVVALSLCVTPLFLFCTLGGAALGADERLTKPALDQKIDEVLSDSRYGWRLPEKPSRSMPSPLEGVKDLFSRIWKASSNLFTKIFGWLFPKPQPNPSSRWDFPAVSSRTIQVLVFLLGGILLVIGGIFIFRVLKLRRPRVKKIGLPSTPDLSDEATVADQLLPQEWVALADKKVETGDLRLALRALFLANLSLLGTRRLIAVERWKSNYDYERELRRKARTQTDLLQLFSKSRERFERCWYGDDAVTESDLAEYSANHERIKHATIENQ